MELSFYKDKIVFVTGHTGFKGSWLCEILVQAGATVIGYSLQPPTSPNLFNIIDLEKKIVSIIGDIRNQLDLNECMKMYKPEIVFHLAAQPIVRDSYKTPVYTYETNVMGTVNILEAIRLCPSVLSFVNVTTDKVYENREWCWGYRENDVLNGFDPYSNSKSCSELVTNSYVNSFFCDRIIGISTCRAGNVIGGGDFANDRIIPDCIRAAEKKGSIVVRNPASIRPYQHVLEPISAYLLIAQKQYENCRLGSSYNIGPSDSDCISTGELVDLFCTKWGDGLSWKNVAQQNAPHEANFLKLDCTKLKSTFNWSSKWSIDTAILKTIQWSKCYLSQGNINELMANQINDYFSEGE